jgi:hypothetical protein
MTRRLGLHEIEFRHLDEPGVSVRLLSPNDRDLFEPLQDHTLTVRAARKLVRGRRRQEKIAARKRWFQTTEEF